VHKGKCVRKMAQLDTGRWFFVGVDEMECRICGGKFGGGSSTRPDGSGLRAHLSRCKNTCGVEWEKLFWKEKSDGWDKWDEEYKLALVVRGITKSWVEDSICEGCGKGMWRRNIGAHIRTFNVCYKWAESEVLGALLDKPGRR